jgi:hypothetical protein
LNLHVLIQAHGRVTNNIGSAHAARQSAAAVAAAAAAALYRLVLAGKTAAFKPRMAVSLRS